MSRLITILAVLAALSACSLAPERPARSWTDALLDEAPPQGAPNTVSEQSMDSGLRRELLASAVEIQRRGAVIREIGATLRAPTVDTAAFVVEARERARLSAPQ